MILNNIELMELVLDTIRTYEEGSIGNFYFYKTMNKISDAIKTRKIKTDTNEVFDTFIKSIEFYNLYITTKEIDCPLISDEWNDIIYSCMSDVVEKLK